MFEAIVQAECKVQGWKVLAFETMPDHVHLLLSIPRSTATSFVAMQLKGASSRELRKKLRWLHHAIKAHFWATGYFVEGVGNADLETVKRYIDNQEREWQAKRRKL